ncbi:MAG: hypothetical protein PUC00_05835 [Clostridiales bacterium]|nr:hypothetical protein [Clostridiales bacterium]
MLRETNVQRLHWADKTMSVIRQEQLEACEKRLSALPRVTVFDLTSDIDVEEVWQCSYDAQEHPRMEKLHTRKELRAQVLGNLAAEAALLSVEEHHLLERLVTLGGTAELLDWEESSAAESLVRRLWCTITRDGVRTILHMPSALVTPLTLTLSSHAHQELREKLMHHDAVIRGLLYIGGLLHYEEPLYHLMTDVLKDSYACDLTLALRYLRSAYDYTYDRQGDMLLLHPGLADPERLSTMYTMPKEFALELSDETMRGAVEGLLPEEEPLFDRLYGLLIGATRPELTPEGAAEDLLMLAKQGVPLSEMQEVLGTLLSVQPTAEMRRAVSLMHAQTPRWGMMHTALAQ